MEGIGILSNTFKVLRLEMPVVVVALCRGQHRAASKTSPAKELLGSVDQVRRSLGLRPELGASITPFVPKSAHGIVGALGVVVEVVLRLRQLARQINCL